MPLNLPPEEHGTVYWVTGLAGAGKTTLARLLVARLRERRAPVLFLDGDVLREVLGAAAGHSPAERLALARQYGALCRMLSRQGADVVCATISMFHEVRRWNRENLTSYCEIYLKVPMDVLVARDQKGLYRKALTGLADNVVGVDSPFEEPELPDIVLANDGSLAPEMVLEELLARLTTWSAR